MIPQDLTSEQADAVSKAMASFDAIERRFGSDPAHLESFDRMIGGHRGFAERLGGDTFFKIDSTFFPSLQDAGEGTSVRFAGITLVNVRKTVVADRLEKLVVTAVDDEAIARFRLEWSQHPGQGDKSVIIVDLDIRECRPHDPEYGPSERIASASFVRHDPESSDKVDLPIAFIQYSRFHKFVEAVDLMRPSIVERLPSLSYGKPFSKGMTQSFYEISLSNYHEIIAADGGMAGRLALLASDRMTEIGARKAHAIVGPQAMALALALEEKGLVYGSGMMTYKDGDNLVCAVRSETNRLALMQTIFGADHHTSLIWTDADGSSQIVVLERGNEVIEAADAFIADLEIHGPSTMLHAPSGHLELPRAFVETDMLDNAVFFTRYAAEAAGKLGKRDGGRIVRDFRRFMEVHADGEDGTEPSVDSPAP